MGCYEVVNDYVCMYDVWRVGWYYDLIDHSREPEVHDSRSAKCKCKRVIVIDCKIKATDPSPFLSTPTIRDEIIPHLVLWPNRSYRCFVLLCVAVLYLLVRCSLMRYS